MITFLANHLWQSTLFALAAAALVAALRGNRAPVRHWIWVIASVKWLVPFAWLMAVGSAVSGMLPDTGVDAPALQAPSAISVSVLQFTEPFTAVDSVVPASGAGSTGWLTIAIVTAWACGVLVLVTIRLRDWLRIRTAIRQSKPFEWSPGSLDPGIDLQDTSLDVRSTTGLLEPGVVGIWRPVLLLPAGIQDQLSPAHLDSVVAHEVCHVRRRDNLTAAVHMVVESVFWFHPLVWWIGARMIEERERACDEDVLARGAHPRDYADGILRICKLYVESPLACVPGVTGSDLKQRIEDIMMHRVGRSLNFTRKVLLTAAAALALAAPVVVGAMAPPQSTAPAAAAQNPQAPKIGDLEAVLKVMRDPAATAVDKERLIGKTYSGVVAISAVRIYPKGAVVFAAPDASATSDKAAIVGLRFAGGADDPKLQELGKEKAARLRGTLIKISAEGKLVWADFTDLVIEEKRP